MKSVFLFSSVLLGLTLPVSSYAQTLMEMGTTMEAAESSPQLKAISPVPAVPATAAIPAQTEGTTAPAATDQAAAAAPSKQGSLFFTEDELQKIQQAKSGMLVASEAGGPQVADPGPRHLKLSGIVYNSDKDWTIWFNGMRVRPGALPERMLALIVKKDRIGLKWLDRGTNKIINLVLRPHEQYNIDTDTVTAGTK